MSLTKPQNISEYTLKKSFNHKVRRGGWFTFFTFQNMPVIEQRCNTATDQYQQF